MFAFMPIALAATGIISTSTPDTLYYSNITNKQSGISVTSSPSFDSISISDTISSEPINIKFTSCTTNNNTVGIKNFTAKYGGSSLSILSGYDPPAITNLPNPRSGGSTLRYGASVFVPANINGGSFSPCFDISIQYSCAYDLKPCTKALPINVRVTTNILIFQPISINQRTQMDFKHMTKPLISSSITMQTNGSMVVAPTSPDATTLLDGNIGHAAEFDISTEKNTGISISIPNGTFVNGIKLTNLVANFNGVTKAVSNSAHFNTNATGKNILKLGATLIVGRTAKKGKHNIPYQMTIDYE